MIITPGNKKSFMLWGNFNRFASAEVILTPASGSPVTINTARVADNFVALSVPAEYTVAQNLPLKVDLVIDGTISRTFNLEAPADTATGGSFNVNIKNEPSVIYAVQSGDSPSIQMVAQGQALEQGTIQDKTGLLVKEPGVYSVDMSVLTQDFALFSAGDRLFVDVGFRYWDSGQSGWRYTRAAKVFTFEITTENLASAATAGYLSLLDEKYLVVGLSPDTIFEIVVTGRDVEGQQIALPEAANFVNYTYVNTLITS